MMAASDIIPQALSEATRACRQSFTECRSIGRLMEDEWAENRLADFNLWDAGVGASAHPLASLDRRLMSQPEAYAIVQGLLKTLRTLVDRCRDSSQRCVMPVARPA